MELQFCVIFVLTDHSLTTWPSSSKVNINLMWPNISPLNPYLESHGEVFFMTSWQQKKTALFSTYFSNIVLHMDMDHCSMPVWVGPERQWGHGIPYGQNFKQDIFLFTSRKNRWPEIWIYIFNYMAGSSGTQNKIGAKRSCKKYVIGHWKCDLRVRM